MTTHDHQRALALYQTVWPHVADGIRRAQSWSPLRADWFAVSTPFFVHDDDGNPIAHAGVVTCHWSTAGRRHDVAAVHGVCVHPDHRGLGHGRTVLERALSWVDERLPCRTTVLWSEKVDLYARFGFRVMRESMFEGSFTELAPSEPTRCIHPDEPRACERLASALQHRRPVSDTLAAVDDGWHFGIDLGLWHAAVGADAAPVIVELIEGGALVVGSVEGDAVQLFDVIATGSLPSIDRLANAIARQRPGPSQPARVQVFFSPDRLPGGDRLGATASPDEDLLMVRGEPLPVAGPFALSPLTRT